MRFNTYCQFLLAIFILLQLSSCGGSGTDSSTNQLDLNPQAQEKISSNFSMKLMEESLIGADASVDVTMDVEYGEDTVILSIDAQRVEQEGGDD